MPLAEFCRWVSNQSGVSIVVEESLDSKPVTIELLDQTIDDSLSAVARRAGVQVTKTGNLYFLGTLRKEDRGTLVRRCRRLSQSDLDVAVGTLLSEFGSKATFADGLLVCGDRVEVLTKIHDLVEQIEATDSPVWVVQLYLLDLSSDDRRSLGLDITPSLDVSLAFAAGSGAGVKPTSNLKGGLGALLRAVASSEGSRIVAQPMFVLGDGQEAKLVRGEKVPIPRRVVSNQGTVTTQGYDYVQTGYTTDLVLRETAPESASLKVVTELSAITRFVESAPVTTVEKMETVAVLASGGVYLLGSLEREDIQAKQSTWLRWGEENQRQDRLLQLWARIYRVAAPAGVVSELGSKTSDSEAADPANEAPIRLPDESEDKSQQTGSTLPDVSRTP